MENERRMLEMKKAKEAEAKAREESIKKDIEERVKEVEESTNGKTPTGSPSLILVGQTVLNQMLTPLDIQIVKSKGASFKSDKDNKQPKSGDSGCSLDDYSMGGKVNGHTAKSNKVTNAPVIIESETSSLSTGVALTTTDQHENEGTSVDQSAKDKKQAKERKDKNSKEGKQSSSGWKQKIKNRNKFQEYKSVPTSDPSSADSKHGQGHSGNGESRSKLSTGKGVSTDENANFTEKSELNKEGFDKTAQWTSPRKLKRTAKNWSL